MPTIICGKGNKFGQRNVQYFDQQENDTIAASAVDLPTQTGWLQSNFNLPIRSIPILVYDTWGITSLGGPTFVDTLPNLDVKAPYNSLASSTADPSWTALGQLHNGLHLGGKQPPSFTKTQSEQYSLRYNIPSTPISISPSDSEAWVKEKNHRHKRWQRGM